MNPNLIVLLDACVLVPASLRDLLLRLAEKSLFQPRWSEDIIAELVRTLEQKLNKNSDQTGYLVRELRAYFHDAWIQDYEHVMDACTNHEKDRHVLAAAIQGGADFIVTFNLKHFPDPALAPWGIECIHPDNFLVESFEQFPEVIVQTLHEQAAGIDRDLSELVLAMKAGLPQFVELVSTTLLKRRDHSG